MLNDNFKSTRSRKNTSTTGIWKQLTLRWKHLLLSRARFDPFSDLSKFENIFKEQMRAKELEVSHPPNPPNLEPEPEAPQNAKGN